MKQALSILIIFIYTISYSQWEVVDSSITHNRVIDTLISENNFIITYDANIYECGLPFSRYEKFIYTFYKTDENPHLLYCKVRNLIDSSYSTGYYSSSEETLSDGIKRICWHEDLAWLFFDRNGKLLKQLFYQNGLIVQPKEIRIERK